MAHRLPPVQWSTSACTRTSKSTRLQHQRDCCPIRSSNASALMLCSPGLANSHTDNLTTATETPAATNLQRLQLPNGECAPLPDPVVPQAWACVLDERQPAQNLVRRDLGIEDEEDTSVPATIIGSLQGSKKHDPQLALTQQNSLLSEPTEGNEQNGADRCHTSASQCETHHSVL